MLKAAQGNSAGHLGDTAEGRGRVSWGWCGSCACFTVGDEWRRTLGGRMRRVCVFCGSSVGARPEYRIEEDPEALLARFGRYHAPSVDKTGWALGLAEGGS